jgi:hypothetical protein
MVAGYWAFPDVLLYPKLWSDRISNGFPPLKNPKTNAVEKNQQRL